MGKIEMKRFFILFCISWSFLSLGLEVWITSYVCVCVCALHCKPCLAYGPSTTRVCPCGGYLVTDAKPLAESNKALAETIGKTVVNCLFRNSGCTWQGSLSDSSSHCSECAFSRSLVICFLCGNQVAHRQGQEHVHVCPVMQQVQMQAYIQASNDVAASQASAQGHGVAAATLTQDHWYQQQYQQYYQNYTGYLIHQQPLHLPGLAPQNASQHQVPYIHPAAQYVAQSHPQMQAQPQLQSQSLVLHQPHPQHPSQTFPASQGLQDLHAQAHSQTKPLSQAHHLTNSQVPQHHQFHGQIQNPMHPQATVLQNGPPQNTSGQCQSNQLHAFLTGQKLSPQPKQTNQVGVPPNNMPVSHQVGSQTQVQNHFLQQVPQVHPPQSLPTMQKLPSQLRRAHTKQLLLKYGRAPVPESSDMHLSQQPLAKPSVPQGPQQHTLAPTTDIIHNQMHQGGLFYNPDIAPQSHLPPIGLVHQPITQILGLQKSRASSSRSLDRGFDQRSPVRPHEMHELDFELRPASRFSQPSIELRERQVRRGPRSPISEHLGMPSHGSGPLDHGLGGSRAETSDIYKFGLLRSEFRDRGNLQREKVQDADTIGPVDINGLRPGDVGFRSRYTLQGFSGDGVSFSGDLGSVSNSRKRATAPVECIGLHSQTKDHQQKSINMDVVIKQNAKKLKMAPVVSSPFCNQNKNEERFGGLG